MTSNSFHAPPGFNPSPPDDDDEEDEQELQGAVGGSHFPINIVQTDCTCHNQGQCCYCTRVRLLDPDETEIKTNGVLSRLRCTCNDPTLPQTGQQLPRYIPNGVGQERPDSMTENQTVTTRNQRVSMSHVPSNTDNDNRTRTDSFGSQSDPGQTEQADRARSDQIQSQQNRSAPSLDMTSK